jgi:hypothetical protein
VDPAVISEQRGIIVTNGKRTTSRSGRRKPEDRKKQSPIKAIKLLIAKRKKAQLTTNGLAELASLDPKNYWRLEHGFARNPGRDTLITLTRALVRYSKMFDESDVDDVLKAAGFPAAPWPECPICHNRVTGNFRR